MAGFQFIALEGEINTDGNERENAIELTIFSTRYLGFAISLAGTLICIVINEYLTCIRNEKIETQVRGICKYAMFIQMADYTAIAATVCLGISTNVLLWRNGFPVVLAVVFNVLFTISGVLLIRAHYVIITKRQNMRYLYDDETFKEAQKRNRSLSFCDKLKGMSNSFLW